MLSPRAIQVANLGVIGLVGLAGLLCPDSLAQSSPATVPVDPFIGAIETMKRSVISVDCVMVHGAEAEILQRAGSAFFISGAGDFLTAAHVILAMQVDTRLCPATAITAPRDGWRPEARDEPRVWFPFNTSGCRIEQDSDVAACRLNEDLSRSKLKSRIAPVKFEWRIPSDGTQVASTGFPLSVRDPVTVRAAVAGYRIPWQNEKPIPELVLDRAAWPGYSGAPVYLSDGRVIGILIAGGPDETPGMAIARPASSFRELLAEKQFYPYGPGLLGAGGDQEETEYISNGNTPSWARSGGTITGSGLLNIRDVTFVPSGFTRADEYTFTTRMGSDLPVKGSWNFRIFDPVTDTSTDSGIYVSTNNTPYLNSSVIAYHCPANSTATTGPCAGVIHETWFVYPDTNVTEGGTSQTGQPKTQVGALVNTQKPTSPVNAGEFSMPFYFAITSLQ